MSGVGRQRDKVGPWVLGVGQGVSMGAGEKQGGSMGAGEEQGGFIGAGSGTS